VVGGEILNMNNNLRISTIVYRSLENVMNKLGDIRGNDKLQPMVTLSFDDGYTSDHSIVMPVFEELGLRGTFFVISDNIGKSRFMTEEQVIDVSRFNEIGSHTKTHPVLTELTDEEIRIELSESKLAIQDVIGKEVTTLCYPYGNNNQRITNLVSGYYDGARAITKNAVDPELNPDSNRGNQGTYSPYSGRLEQVTVYGTKTKEAILAKSADPLHFQDWKNIIDDFLSLDEPAWYVFMFHEVYEDDDSDKPENRMNKSLFKQCMEYLNEKKRDKELDVVTFKEGLQRINNAQSIHLK